MALHGYRHRLQLRLGAATVRDDMRRGQAVIEDATGTPRALAPTAVRDLQRGRTGRGARCWPPSVAVVAVGEGLAQVHHAGANRPARRPPGPAPAT